MVPQPLDSLRAAEALLHPLFNHVAVLRSPPRTQEEVSVESVVERVPETLGDELGQSSKNGQLSTLVLVAVSVESRDSSLRGEEGVVAHVQPLGIVSVEDLRGFDGLKEGNELWAAEAIAGDRFASDNTMNSSVFEV